MALQVLTKLLTFRETQNFNTVFNTFYLQHLYWARQIKFENSGTLFKVY